MKKIKLLMLLAFMLIGMLGYSQYDVQVKNLINTRYDITAVWLDSNSNIKQKVYHLNAVNQTNSVIDLPYYHPNFNNYTLHHWKIQAHDCYPALDAQHEYGTADTDAITHCHQCTSGNAVSDYTINGTQHTDIVGCR